MEYRFQNYNRAFEKITTYRGFPYPCSQVQLDILHNPKPSVRTSAVPPDQAVTDVIRINDHRRIKSSNEQLAVNNLLDAVEFPTEDWMPDLIIKMFPDLDTVFFGGWLVGKVRVGWSQDADKVNDHILGVTQYDLEAGLCSIWLNAKLNLVDRDVYKTPGKSMWAVMLHEMIQ